MKFISIISIQRMSWTNLLLLYLYLFMMIYFNEAKPCGDWQQYENSSHVRLRRSPESHIGAILSEIWPVIRRITNLFYTEEKPQVPDLT